MLGVDLKRDDSLDLELPLEVDDEYWEAGAPGDAFHQVGDKPSLITGFVCWIKLSYIAATALRTLVSLSPTHLFNISDDALSTVRGGRKAYSFRRTCHGKRQSQSS